MRIKDYLFIGRFRFAAILGIVSIPLSVWLNYMFPDSGAELIWTLLPLLPEQNSNVSAVVIACLISGYLYRPRSAKSTDAGAATAVIGGLPIVVWQLSSPLLNSLGGAPLLTPFDSGILDTIVSVVVILVVFGVLMAAFWILGMICGGLSSWLGDRLHSMASSKSGQ